jgi:hypothetical protein
MPVFLPGAPKVATVPVVVTPAGLSCRIKVFLGPNETTESASSGWITFTSTGASQNVACAVVMPAAAGTYHAYIDLQVSDGSNWFALASYVATDNVIVPGGSVSPPVWS